METNTPLDTVVVANADRKLLTGDPCLITCLCKTNAASSTRAGCGLTDFPMSEGLEVGLLGSVGL